MTPLIEALALGKSFGDVRAVAGVSFSIERGATVGFVGPNGAGKTTTFRMLAGSLGPSEGQVRIAGHDLATSPFEAKRLIGYMPEAPPLYPEMTAREYLEYRSDLKGLPRKSRKKTAQVSAERAHIEAVLGTPIGQLSKGFKQRVALADALLGEPPVLLLDEPTAGLDPNQVLEVRALLRELGRERAVLLSTHVLSEVEAVCETALVIHRGHLVARGSLTELKARASSKSARLVVRSDAEGVRRVLGTLVSALEFEPEAEGRSCFVASASASASGGAHELIELLTAALVQARVAVLEATPERAALDEVFSALTLEGATPKAEARTKPRGAAD